MVEKATNLVYSTLALVSLEDFKTDEAQKRFLDFQNTGIINSSSRYEDPMWKLTDEYSNIGLYFTGSNILILPTYFRLITTHFFLIRKHLPSHYWDALLSARSNVCCWIFGISWHPIMKIFVILQNPKN